MRTLDRVGVVGATGAVGSRLLAILEERGFAVSELRPFASPRSRGKFVSFANQQWPCRELESGCFEGLSLVFFDASDEVSAKWVPEALAAGAVVVDNSATFRMDADVPLLVPEVNASQATSAWASGQRLFAGPNCSTVQLVMALAPLQCVAGLKRVVVSTYQSVSGAGTAAMHELQQQSLGGRAVEVFPHRIAENLIPRIGGVRDGGFTSEEDKLMRETQKILGTSPLPIVATAVRVPTLLCHAESVFVELERELSPEAARKLWSETSGVVVWDDLALDLYPMNENASNQDVVAIGRIRRDPSVPHGLCFWVVSDNLRKGAALNAVQIAEWVRDHA